MRLVASEVAVSRPHSQLSGQRTTTIASTNAYAKGQGGQKARYVSECMPHAPAKLHSSPVIITRTKSQIRSKGEYTTYCSFLSTIAATRPSVAVHSEASATQLLTDLRYATPSPATPPACERSKPFFLNTKLEPMSRPLQMARTMPTTCGVKGRKSQPVMTVK